MTSTNPNPTTNVAAPTTGAVKAQPGAASHSSPPNLTSSPATSSGRMICVSSQGVPGDVVRLRYAPMAPAKNTSLSR